MATREKQKNKAVLVWFPRELVDELDIVAKRIDSDRSKLIRLAARQKLEALAKNGELSWGAAAK